MHKLKLIAIICSFSLFLFLGCAQTKFLNVVAPSTIEKEGCRIVTVSEQLSFSPATPNDEHAVNALEVDHRHEWLSTEHRFALDDQMELIDRPKPPATLGEKLLSDQLSFYSKESGANLLMAFGVGALLANSEMDGKIQKHFQASVRGATSDEWFEFLHANKEIGNGMYTLPIFGSLWLANTYIDGPESFETAGVWGERSLRAFLVGAGPVVIGQRLTGGSRPDETGNGSDWLPFRDNNGVSGHAFMSSLPFITAAKMTDGPIRKTLFYGGSLIGPLSRVNDNAHYPSQIGIGWAMAFVAASAVQHTDTGKRGWSIVPSSSLNSSGLAFQYRW
jgi:hypothetical protein